MTYSVTKIQTYQHPLPWTNLNTLIYDGPIILNQQRKMFGASSLSPIGTLFNFSSTKNKSERTKNCHHLNLHSETASAIQLDHEHGHNHPTL